MFSAKTPLAAAVATALSATLAAHAKPVRLDIDGWMQVDSADPATAPKWNLAVLLEEGQSKRVSFGGPYRSLSVEVTLTDWDNSFAAGALQFFDGGRLISAPILRTGIGNTAQLMMGTDAEYVFGVSVHVSGD